MLLRLSGGADAGVLQVSPSQKAVWDAGYDHGAEDAEIDEGSWNTTDPCDHGDWCPFAGTYHARNSGRIKVKADGSSPGSRSDVLRATR